MLETKQYYSELIARYSSRVMKHLSFGRLTVSAVAGKLATTYLVVDGHS